MKPIQETNKTNWTAQKWQGNPELNLQCSCKIFVNPLNGSSVPVWIFGGTKEYPGFNYCVNAGANSSHSYTGRVNATELNEAETEVQERYDNNKIFR